MPDLTISNIGLIGGLNDSSAVPEPGDFQTLRNFSLYRGRLGLRAPLIQTANITDVTINGILASAYHRGLLYVAAYADALDTVRLYSLTTAGASPTFVATVWTGVTTRPSVVMASFDGGSATNPLSRLYIADTLQIQPTVFLSNGATITNVTEDFDDNGTKENLIFSYVFAYNFHMFGAGFLQSAVARPELLRASRPGLISETEPNVVNNTSREWFFVDQLPVGIRGEPIVSHGYAGESVVLLKQNRTYTMFGYDINTFTLKLINDKVGAVGKRATCWTDDGLCFFWSFRGLMMTDGSQVRDLSESVRNSVAAIGNSPDIVVEYSADDGQIYIMAPSGNELAFDKTKGKFWEPQYLASSPLVPGAAAPIPTTTLPGPSGAPTLDTMVAISDSQIDITWTNADTSLGVTTEIYIDPSSPATSFLVSKAAGVASASVTGLPSISTRYIRLRHLKNAQFSSYSNEKNAKTWLKAPTNLVASQLSNGVHLEFVNNEASSDLQIERKTTAGSVWGTVTTLTNQSTGAKTYDDTTGTCGISYDYRVLDKKSGEHDSIYSNIATQTACSSPPDIGAAHFTRTGGASCADLSVSIIWSGTNFSAGDRAKIYQNDNGGGYVLRANVPLTDGEYVDTWPWADDTPINVRTLQYKIEAWDEGTTLSDTFTMAQQQFNVSTVSC